MESQTLLDEVIEADRPARAIEGTPRDDERVLLERLALISDDRARLNPRSELDILALMGSGAGSNGVDCRQM
jgi:hypothetical protein